MKLYLNLFHCILAAVLLSSCAASRSYQLQPQPQKNNCNQHNAYTYAGKDLPKAIHDIEIDTALISRFSFKSLNVAHAIGIKDILSEYVHIKKVQKDSISIENRIKLLELSQKINHKISTSSLEISATASEMDCEEERADQIASYLKTKEDDAETKFTVAAIIVGASGAVASGLLAKNGNTGDYVGIATGLTEATLGALILLNKRKIDFYHPRNALKDIWEGNETSEIFPAPIWYYINYYNPKTPENQSLRYQIIERWMNFGQIAEASRKDKRKLIQIYFGKGGKYTAEQLNNRANMYDQLEALINLMKQDLKGLAIEFENLKF